MPERTSRKFWVMWFYVSNFKGQDGKPRPSEVIAWSDKDAINKGVFFQAPEFRAEAWYLVWDEQDPTPRVVRYAEASDD